MSNIIFWRFVRRFIFALGYYSGLFEWVRLFFVRRGYAPVLVYHRVIRLGEEQMSHSCFSSKGLIVSERAFEEQIKYLKAKYNVCSLRDYVDMSKGGRGARNAAVITFDDGFKEMGLDVLRKYNVPATVFLTGEGFKDVFWKHLLYNILDAAAVLTAVFSWGACELTVRLDSDEAKMRTLKSLIGVFEPMTQAERNKAFDALSQSLRINVPGRTLKLYLDEWDICELQHHNIHFGAHSVTHRDMRMLNDDELLEEIRGSRRLAESFESASVCFSLPFGCYDERVLSFLKQEMLHCVCTSDEGLNPPGFDEFRIKRIAITTENMPEFVYQVSGTQMLLHELIKKLKYHG